MSVKFKKPSKIMTNLFKFFSLAAREFDYVCRIQLAKRAMIDAYLLLCDNRLTDRDGNQLKFQKDERIIENLKNTINDI